MAAALIHLTADEAVAVGTLALAAVGLLTLVINVFLVRSARTQTEATRQSAEATQKAAEATLREAKLIKAQVEVADEQIKVSERQFKAMKKQADVAEKAFRAQSEPRLIPAGMDMCEVGKVEPIRDERNEMIQPFYVGVINAGQGAAVIDLDGCSATCGEGGGAGSVGIVPPPALAGGGSGKVKLTPQYGGAQALIRGMRYQIVLSYYVVLGQSIRMTETLEFEVRYFSRTHWEIQITST